MFIMAQHNSCLNKQHCVTQAKTLKYMLITNAFMMIYLSFPLRKQEHRSDSKMNNGTTHVNKQTNKRTHTHTHTEYAYT